MVLFANVGFGAPRCAELQNALKSLRFVPYAADGLLQGYVIQGVKTDSVVAKVGLQEKDLLLDISGHRLNAEKALQSVLADLCKAKGPLAISLLRSGKPLNLEVALSSPNP